MKRFLSFALLLLSFSMARAQGGSCYATYFSDADADSYGASDATIPSVLINEGFDNLSTTLSSGWSQQNFSSSIGTTSYFQGDQFMFNAHSGAADTYAAVNYNSGAGLSTLDNWLITPEVSLENGAQFKFWSRTVPFPTYPDRLQVRMSVAAASTNISDFTTLLLDINPTYSSSGYPTEWTEYTATVTGIVTPTTGRFAFRYFVENGGPFGANSDYIGIDDVNYALPSINSILACGGAPAGYVLNNTDCADSNPAVNPSVTEVCNGIDDNCNSIIDDVILAFQPNVFPQDSWNLYAFNSQDYSSNYAGYYSTTGSGFNTTLDWAGDAAPSSAAGWNGCIVDIDNHTYSIKRQGFPSYTNGSSIRLNSWDDDVEIFVNGISVYSAGCCGNSAFISTWSGLLDGTSTIEVRIKEYGGESFVSFDVIEVIPGCVDPNACNFNSLAVIDDGSCVMPSLEYYYDNDGDGYGINDPWFGTTLFCTPQDAPWSLTNTDCNDFNALINPNATEICNGIDEDCNGAADDGLVFNEYFVDADADGYGVIATNYVVTPITYQLLTPQVISSNVTLDLAGRIMSYTGISINGATNAEVVAAGSSVSLTYNLAVTWGPNLYCPGCVTQSYIGIGGSTTTLQCEDGIYDGYTNSYNSGTFTAPTTPGTYYLVQNGTLDFLCQPQTFDNTPTNAIAILQVEGTLPTVANPGPNCDDCTTQIPIGFTFPFYENTYSNVTISSNGYVSFDVTGESGCCNGNIVPVADAVNNLVALGWTDLLPNAGQLTYFNLSNPNRLVIEYSNVPEFGNTGSLSGQIVLFESGEIQMIYSNLSLITHVATAGLENATGTTGVTLPGLNSQSNSLTNVAYRFVYTTSPTVPGISSCSAIAGYATNNTDCLDSDIAINPGATELCNGIDDDCDGVIELQPSQPTLACYETATFNTTSCVWDVTVIGGITTYYADIDVDGFGDVSTSIQGYTCIGAPAGYVTDATDCNDGNAAINPAATEICSNGIDDNCDGIQSEMVAGAYDNDAPHICTDVVGHMVVYANSGIAPYAYTLNTAGFTDAAGYYGWGANAPGVYNWSVTDATGCSQSGSYTITIPAPIMAYADTDLDGFGAGAEVSVCSLSAGYVLTNTDCDDAVAAINPGATEICNEVDDNCDGQIDEGVQNTYYADNDGDGFGGAGSWSIQACTAPLGFVTSNNDCQDNNPAINPGASEVCNTIDDNCDGQINEGFGPLTLYYADADGDGYGNGTQTIDVLLQGSSSASVSNGSLVIVGSNTFAGSSLTGSVSFVAPVDATYTFDWSYSTVDSGPNWDPAYYINGTAYPLTDDFGPQTQSGTQSVTVTAGSTFGFSVVTVDDVAGSATLTINNFNGFPLPTFTQACSQPAGYAVVNGDCDDAVAAINPGATEVCNGIDDNCSGVADEGLTFTDYYADLDLDGYGAGAATNACAQPIGFVTTNTDCDDNNASANPAATEICNTIDDNCDGQIDEGVQNTYYEDMDGDGYGSMTFWSIQACSAPFGFVSSNNDCADNNPAINPGATEACNTIDDNCDGQINEGFGPLTLYYADADGDGYGNGTQTIDVLLQGSSSASVSNGSLVIVGSNTFTGSPLTGSVSFVAPVDATYTFDWSYSTVDSGPNWDPAYYINGTAYPLTDDFGPQTQSGTQSVTVTAGSTFGFSVVTVDDVAGSATLTINNFNGFTLPTFTQACSQPAGYAVVNGDCDDANSVINPAATEICSNGIDDNCDGIQSEMVAGAYDNNAPHICTDVVGYMVVFANSGIAPYAYTLNTDGFTDAAGYYGWGANAPGVYNWSVTDATGCSQSGSYTITIPAPIMAYVDTDLDGFGGGAAVSVCSLSAGYVLTNTDCNNNNAAVNPSATELCTTSVDDNCNGLINEGCAIAGEDPSNATSITPSIWPACSPVSGTLVGASASTSAQTICLTGEDKWHQFVATTEGVSIVVNSTSADIVIELQTAAGVLVAQENAVSGLGGEILNHYGLTAGQVYKVGVRNYNSAQGTGTYSICAKMLKRGGCDYGPGPYTLCQYFKATWAGATGTSYTYTFTGISGPASGNVYTRTQNSDICVLSSVLPTLPYGSTYNVLITNTYTINNGAGVAETISVPGLAPCTMSTATQPVTVLRTTDRCAAGPRFRGAVVAALPWVCGATNWRWEFTELDASGNPVGLPITVNRGAASNYITLSTVAQLQYGKTYNVRTAPILSYTGTNYQWGTTACMSIVGTAGMIAEGGSESESSTKVEIANEVNMSLYPNPTHGTDVNINLSGVTSENVQIRVVDAMGRQVWSNRYSVDGILNTNITFERPLANGLYFVEAIYNGELQTQRMMVQK